jgi:hypothetical protein
MTPIWAGQYPLWGCYVKLRPDSRTERTSADCDQGALNVWLSSGFQNWREDDSRKSAKYLDFAFSKAFRRCSAHAWREKLS